MFKYRYLENNCLNTIVYHVNINFVFKNSIMGVVCHYVVGKVTYRCGLAAVQYYFQSLFLLNELLCVQHLPSTFLFQIGIVLWTAYLLCLSLSQICRKFWLKLTCLFKNCIRYTIKSWAFAQFQFCVCCIQLFNIERTKAVLLFEFRGICCTSYCFWIQCCNYFSPQIGCLIPAKDFLLCSFFSRVSIYGKALSRFYYF